MSTATPLSFPINFPRFQDKPFSLAIGGSENTLIDYLNTLAVDGAGYGILPSNSDNTAAFNRALAAGKSIRLKAGTYNFSGQLLMNTSGQYIIGAGRFGSGATTLKGTYASGPIIDCGNGTAQTFDMGFENLFLWAPAAGQIMTRQRWLRGLTFRTCRILADCGWRGGDETLNAVTQNAYVTQFIDCEMNQTGGTLTFLDGWNYAGQFCWLNSFLDGSGDGGTAADGVHGFSMRNNIRTRCDNAYFIQGSLHRFDHNLDAEDGRVVNVFISNMVLDESKRGAIVINSPSGSSKSPTDVGGGNWAVDNVTVDAKSGPAIYIGCSRNDANNANEVLSFDNINLVGAYQTTTPIVIENTSTAPNVMQQISFKGLKGYVSAADNLQDVVRVTASATALTVQDVHIDDVQVEFKGAGTGRSILRVEGAGITRVSCGSLLSGKKVTAVIDDQSGKLLRAGAYAASDTFDYGTVGANTAVATHTISVPGAVLLRNDSVQVTVQSGGAAVGLLTFRGAVTADNVVTITVLNSTSAGVASGSTILLLKVRPGDQ